MPVQGARDIYSVVLLWEQGMPARTAEETAVWFRQAPGPLTVTVSAPSVSVPTTEGGTLAWNSVFAALREQRQQRNLPASTFVYLLTHTPNEHNWFAVEDKTEMRSGFGHVDDFSWITTAPPSAVPAHYLLKAVCNALLHEAGVDWEALWHREPRGCFFDFCGHKADLGLKLKTGDICGDCLTVLRDAGIPEALLSQAVHVMDAQRRRAVNCVQYFEAEPAFANWPFPVAVTRHKVAQASNQLHRLLLLLDHFDSLVRFVVLTQGVEAGHVPEIPVRPSLGWWVESLAAVRGRDTDFREVLRIAERENIVSLRNEKRGHGWMSVDDRSYKDEAARLESILGAIEERLSPFLSDRRLVVPDAIYLEGGEFVVGGRLLAGSNVLTPRFEKRLAAPVSVGITTQGQVYLTDVRMEVFRALNPWVLARVCPRCLQEGILITDGGRCYIDALMGHRVELPA